MALSRAMEISLSGVEAQRLTMELIASNLANINTTRTVYGGPYRARMAVLAEKPLSFQEELAIAEGKIYAGGVEVIDVVEDQSAFPKVYKPGHPDADAEGFLSLPNVKLSKEMVNQVTVARIYDANITAYNASKEKIQTTMQIH